MAVVGRADADHLARPVVVGVDGSRTAAHAALWAVDEAVSRDIPLRLVSVIAPVGISGAHADAVQDASARAALYDVRRAIEATGKPVKIETEILWGKPLAALIEQSLWAAMVCVGSIGLKHACDGVDSVAAGLAALAPCPVAVIRRPVGRPATPRVGGIVVDVHNGVVLRHALEEARLRGAPLRAISVSGDREAGRRRRPKSFGASATESSHRPVDTVVSRCANRVRHRPRKCLPISGYQRGRRSSCSSLTRTPIATCVGRTTRDARYSRYVA